MLYLGLSRWPFRLRLFGLPAAVEEFGSSKYFAREEEWQNSRGIFPAHLNPPQLPSAFFFVAVPTSAAPRYILLSVRPEGSAFRV